MSVLVVAVCLFCSCSSSCSSVVVVVVVADVSTIQLSRPSLTVRHGALWCSRRTSRRCRCTRAAMNTVSVGSVRKAGAFRYTLVSDFCYGVTKTCPGWIGFGASSVFSVKSMYLSHTGPAQTRVLSVMSSPRPSSTLSIALFLNYIYFF